VSFLAAVGQQQERARAFHAGAEAFPSAASPRSMLAALFAGASYLLVASLFLTGVSGAIPAVLPDLAGRGPLRP
jgi:hypothetical protein